MILRKRTIHRSVYNVCKPEMLRPQIARNAQKTNYALILALRNGRTATKCVRKNKNPCMIENHAGIGQSRGKRSCALYGEQFFAEGIAFNGANIVNEKRLFAVQRNTAEKLIVA